MRAPAGCPYPSNCTTPHKRKGTMRAPLRVLQEIQCDRGCTDLVVCKERVWLSCGIARNPTMHIRRSFEALSRVVLRFSGILSDFSFASCTTRPSSRTLASPKSQTWRRRIASRASGFALPMSPTFCPFLRSEKLQKIRNTGQRTALGPGPGP